MDKELYDLKNWAIETLKEYKAELLVRKQVTGKPPSALKKVDRFLNALAVDTSGTYADMIDDARRKGLSQKELANMGRNLEERIMNSFRVLPDDPAHHMYSLRTAGDLVQNVEPGVREMGLQMLRDEGYILGNVRENLTSLAEATHQGRTGKGAELKALGNITVDKTKTDIAHPRGTGDPLISRTIDYKGIKTPEDFANAYRPLLEQQKADITGALKTEAPRREIITEFVEEQGGPKNIFSTSRSPVEVKAGRDIIKKAPNVMQRAYQSMKLNFVGGKAMFSVLPMGLVPAVGTGFDILEAKEKTERAAETGAPLDKLQAGIAQVTAATSPIPEPVSQGINFVGGAVNFVIDAIRAPSAPVTDEDLEFSTM